MQREWWDSDGMDSYCMYIFGIITNGVFKALFEYNMKNALEHQTRTEGRWRQVQKCHISCVWIEERYCVSTGHIHSFLCVLYICQAERPPWCLVDLIRFFEAPSSQCDTDLETQSYQCYLEIYHILKLASAVTCSFCIEDLDWYKTLRVFLLLNQDWSIQGGHFCELSRSRGHHCKLNAKVFCCLNVQK